MIDRFDILIATHDDEILRCFDVLKELRPDLQREDFLERVHRQRQQGYILAFLVAGDKVHSVIGYRFLEFLAWGKVLYIDDLITGESSRGNGFGGKLLDWAIEQGKTHCCDAIHLDTGPQRHDAHRVYLNHGFQFNSFHLKKTIRAAS